MTEEEAAKAIKLIAQALCKQYDTNIKLVAVVDALLECLKESGVLSQERLEYWDAVRKTELATQREGDHMLHLLQQVAQG